MNPWPSTSQVNIQLLGLPDVESKVVALEPFNQTIYHPPIVRLIITCNSSNNDGVVGEFKDGLEL